MSGTALLDTPSLIQGVDICSLPINSTEAFVLSRIDGTSSIEDLSFLCGISIEEIERILHRLVELGAVRWTGDEPSTDESDRLDANAGMSQVQERPSNVARQRQTSQDTSSEYEHIAELEQDIDLSIERQKEILDAFHRIDKQNHYQTLGVSQDADKQGIRSAYFELSKRYHTDSVFGKRLGGFKAKMEAVFKRLTQAYEVLGKKTRRREYDEYLAATAQTQEIEQLLTLTQDQPDSSSKGLRMTVVERTSAEGSADRGSAADMRSRASSVRSESSSRKNEHHRISVRPSLTPEERRSRKEKVLRMRLSTVGDASSMPPSQISSSLPPTNPQDDKVRRDSLIRNLASSLDAASKITGGRDKCTRYLKEAQTAESRGDFVEAANRLQLAVTFGPDREDIKAEYQRVRTTIASRFADKFEKQAIYEEKEGKWTAAAQSWSRVCDGRPTDAHCAIRAAEAFLKTSGDIRKAYQFAQKAVDIEPNNVSYLLVLARIDLVIGHKLNAKRELERAAKLDPKNKIVKDLLKEVR